MTDVMLVHVKPSSELTATLLLPIRVTRCQNQNQQNFQYSLEILKALQTQS